MPKTICSIFFQPLKALRPYALRPPQNVYAEPGGFSHLFEIPAAKNGGYESLTIPDTMYEDVYIIKGQRMHPPVFGDHLAADLLQEWRDVINHNIGGPGIFVCVGDKPTEQELAAARARQTVWCRKLVDDAENSWKIGKRDEVKQLHRDAAAFLGQHNFEWLHDDGEVIMRNCPACYSKVNSAAWKCPTCQTTIDFQAQQEHMIRQAKMQDELQAAITQLAKVDPKAAEEARAATLPPKPMAAPLQPNTPKQVRA